MVLHIRGLTKSYGTGEAPRQDVLRGLNWQLAPGATVAVLGASGCGKSTLLNCIAGFERPDSGTVQVAGQDLAQLGDNARARFRRHTLGVLFQEHHLLPTATVLENVLLPALAAGRAAARLQEARARALLNDLGLAGRASSWPHQLSGGEQQRVAAARAVLMKPALILADEPTGALDEANADSLMDLLLTLQAAEGSALVVVTHDQRVAARMEQRYTLRQGRLEAIHAG